MLEEVLRSLNNWFERDYATGVFEIAGGSIGLPEGWLLDQLRTQAEGLSGKLYKIWDDVNEKSAWLGGEGDGWERAPYYLDGLIPLAWELDDEELKGVCQKYIEWILGSAREDGWFGPEKNDDYWPLMVALKKLCASEWFGA